MDHDSNIKILASRNDRFRRNQKIVLDKRGFQLTFPKKIDNFPLFMKEIFTIFEKSIRADDIIQLLNGTLYSEDVLNLFFKILERINQVLIAAQNFLK